jgi:hypothetical protein
VARFSLERRASVPVEITPIVRDIWVPGKKGTRVTRHAHDRLSNVVSPGPPESPERERDNETPGAPR